MGPVAVEDKSKADIGPPASDEGRSDKPHEAALLAALREFVKHVGDSPGAAAKKITLFQWLVLLALVLDASLLYSELERWLDSPVFTLGLKVLPWLLGATAFASSERVREWFLAQCGRGGLGILALMLFVTLLTLRQPLFSVKVQVDSVSTDVKVDDKQVTVYREGKIFVVRLPELTKAYTISVQDNQNADSKPYSLVLGRGRVIRATLARIPLVGRMFGDTALSLTPLYVVLTKSKKPGAYADIEGEFEEGFFQQDLASRKCSPTAATKPGLRAVRCSLDEGTDAVNLPHGWYEITVFRDNCKKRLPRREVKEYGNAAVNFDEICSQ